MSRPADTVTKLEDYLWWLLPSFLKKKDRTESLVAKLCAVGGGLLDTGRDTLTEILPLLLVESATGTYLDQLARARHVLRGVGESDESLRIRVLAAHEIKRKGGTIPGMQDGLAALGYTVQVEEPNQGASKWSRFLVRVLGWDGVVANQQVFYSTVRQLKPAHTRALVESALESEVWDDWDVEDPPEALDIGWLDGWQPTA